MANRYRSSCVLSQVGLFPMVLLTLGVQSVTSHANHMIISNMCRPHCTFGTTCVERPSLCSFSNCPTYLSCIPTSTLPDELLQSHAHAQALTSMEPTARPGCPNLSLRGGPCITQCRRDMDCGHGQICCPNNCGQLCMPDLREVQAPKPGSCPRHLPNPNPACESECGTDHDCPGMQKCCQSSCGAKTCTTPCFLQLTGGRWRQSRRCRRRSHTTRHSRRNKRKFRALRRTDFSSWFA